ncbi:MAG: hypothetical protein AAF790_12395 [Planctomycetota bacterium]
MAPDRQNPYASPRSDEAAAAKRPPVAEPASKRRLAAWCGGWLLNMPVAAVFGWGGTTDSGRLGMFVGIVALMLIGGVGVLYTRRFGRAVVIGTPIFAVTQFYPLIQIYCGLFTAFVMEAIGLGAEDLGFAGGLLATLVCGGMLMACCYAVAIPVWFLVRR